MKLEHMAGRVLRDEAGKTITDQWRRVLAKELEAGLL